jgi:phospholipid/cholesterol/gamma-HCH transport system substrate-binding protein
MNAAKENFLLRGYFRRQAEAAEEKKQEAEEQKADALKQKEKADKKAARQKAREEKK